MASSVVGRPKPNAEGQTFIAVKSEPQEFTVPADPPLETTDFNDFHCLVSENFLKVKTEEPTEYEPSMTIPALDHTTKIQHTMTIPTTELPQSNISIPSMVLYAKPFKKIDENSRSEEARIVREKMRHSVVHLTEAECDIVMLAKYQLSNHARRQALSAALRKRSTTGVKKIKETNFYKRIKEQKRNRQSLIIDLDYIDILYDQPKVVLTRFNVQEFRRKIRQKRKNETMKQKRKEKQKKRGIQVEKITCEMIDSGQILYKKVIEEPSKERKADKLYEESTELSYFQLRPIKPRYCRSDTKSYVLSSTSSSEETEDEWYPQYNSNRRSYLKAKRKRRLFRKSLQPNPSALKKHYEESNKVSSNSLGFLCIERDTLPHEQPHYVSDQEPLNSEIASTIQQIATAPLWKASEASSSYPSRDLQFLVNTGDNEGIGKSEAASEMSENCHNGEISQVHSEVMLESSDVRNVLPSTIVERYSLQESTHGNSNMLDPNCASESHDQAINATSETSMPEIVERTSIFKQKPRVEHIKRSLPMGKTYKTRNRNVRLQCTRVIDNPALEARVDDFISAIDLKNICNDQQPGIPTNGFAAEIVTNRIPTECPEPTSMPEIIERTSIFKEEPGVESVVNPQREGLSQSHPNLGVKHIKRSLPKGKRCKARDPDVRLRCSRVIDNPDLEARVDDFISEIALVNNPSLGRPPAPS